MSKGKLILIAALTVICAAVNLPRILGRSDHGQADPEFLEDREPSGELAPHLDPREEAWQEPPPSPPAREAATGIDKGSSELDPEDDAEPEWAELVKNLEVRTRRDRGIRIVPLTLESHRNPFDLEPTPADPEPVEATGREDRRAEEARRKAAEEALREAAALEAELAALRGLEVRAIIRSPRGGVVRLLGYNLEPGDVVPGHRAVVKAVHRDHIELGLDDKTVSIYLTAKPERGKP